MPHLRPGERRSDRLSGTEWGIVRAIVFKRDGKVCAECDFMGPTTEVYDDDGKRLNFLTIDHVIPVVLGGSDHPDNLRVLCFECNDERSNGQGTISRIGWMVKHPPKRQRLDVKLLAKECGL